MKIGDVRPFKYTYSDDKRQFLEPLEKASGILSAWHHWVNRRNNSRYCLKAKNDLLDEIADCIQACVNCADALGVEDMTKLMNRRRIVNERKGRY